MKKTTIAVSEEAKQFLEEEKVKKNLETFDEVILSWIQEQKDKKNKLADRVMEEINSYKPSKKVKIPGFDLNKLEEEYYDEQF